MPLPPSLTPHVVVYATDDLANLLRSNELPPLHDLLENFSPLGQVITRTTTLVPVTHPSFALRFSDLVTVESSCREDEEIRASRTIDWIGGRIARKAPAWVEDLEAKKKGEPMMGDTKWWAELKACVDGDRVPVHGEGWNHPVALILATTTLAANPLQAVTNLHSRIVDFPPWVDQNIMRYTLVVHPTNKSNLTPDETNALMNATKKQFGLHCHLLPLNLAKPATPKPLKPIPPTLPPMSSFPVTPEKPPPPQARLSMKNGTKEISPEYLNLSDEDQVAANRFLREFVTQSLIPWMERNVMEWNDIYSSSRRLPSRLFSSTRRLFGSSTSNSMTSSVSAPTSPASIPSMPFSNQPQALLPQRRLAEFATFIGDYKLAVPLWESIRKEGKGGSDILPMLLAPSLTLEAHAAYALAPVTTGTMLGGKEGVRIGAAAQLKALVYAIRWEQGVKDLLQMGGERWLVWAAGSTEETPMALLVAHAALLSLRRGVRRTAAMWYIFAANRLEKCGVKALTMYFLKRAHELYQMRPEKLLSPSFEDVEGKDATTMGFDSILPTLEHALGRMAYGTGDIAGAVRFFLGLLKGSVFVSGVPRDGDKVFLEDFRLSYEHLRTTSRETPAPGQFDLPVSISQPTLTRKRFASVHTREGDLVDSDEATEGVMETLQTRWRDFWKTVPGNKKETLEKGGSGEVGEKFWVDVVVRNPLDTELLLSDVTLVLREVGKEDSVLEGIDVQTMEQLTLDPKEERTISLFVCAHRTASVEVTHFSFNFLALLPIRESLGLRGKRLNDTLAQQRSVTYAPDRYMRVDVKQSGGRLKVEVLEEPLQPKELGVGELRSVTLKLTNTGATSVSEIWTIFGDSGYTGSVWVHLNPSASEDTEETGLLRLSNSLAHPEPFRLPLKELHGTSTLAPGESFDLPLVLQSHMLNPFDLAMLLVFRQDDTCQTFYSSILRKVFEVEPLIDVIVGVRPSKAHQSGYTVSLDIENLGACGDVKLAEVSAISPSWRWKEAKRNHELDVLQERQVARLFGGVEQLPEGPPTESFDYLVRKMDDLLQGRPIQKDKPPPLKLHISMLRQDAAPGATQQYFGHFVHATRRQRLYQTLLSQFPLIPPNDLQHIFPLYTSSDFEVVVSWTIPSSKPERKGFTLVSGVTVGPHRSAFAEAVLKAEMAMAARTSAGGKMVRNMYAETTREREALVASVRHSAFNQDDDPLVVKLGCVERVEHDFSSGPLPVPVTYEICNNSPFSSVQFTFTIASKDIPSSSTGFKYIGASAKRGTIPASSSVSVPAKVLVIRPGVYELEQWQLQSRIIAPEGTSSTPSFTQRAPPPSEQGFALIVSSAPP